jgi:2-oxoglutarate ferredoxin oxidoreductase subunit beta
MSTNGKTTNGSNGHNEIIEAAFSAESEGGESIFKIAPPPGEMTRKDFITNQEVRWCPGCGDYAILANVQKVFPDLGIQRENIVWVSGIGCSSRFPYYMNTYGFHSIHGRAPAIATGVKAANPDLSVWVATGDGDALSIGGNHFMHAIRRNLDIKYILFNNRIYGLTKGQYSPTSVLGQINKSAPMGVIDYPLNPTALAIASESTFVARSIDIDVKHLSAMVKAMAEHKGVSFLEVYQNCNIFNDNAFDYFAERTVRPDRVLYLEHGQPMVFGKDKNKGIRVVDGKPQVVTIGENGITIDDILVHDIYLPDPSLAFMLARMEYHEGGEFPQPVGIFRAVQRATYEDMLEGQIENAISKRGKGNLEKLIYTGDMWMVE